MPHKTSGLKERLANTWAKARAAHDAGGTGCDVCALLCAGVDATLIDLFHADGDPQGALVAMGGYGRGLLNPSSDVDILFLLKEGQSPPHRLLAHLWDLGMKVGHSARTVADTLVMGLSDLTARTAMIESRFLAGDRDLFEEFRRKYAKKVIGYRPDQFLEAKVAEMHRRHEQYGRYVKLTEPNIKESPGGLRDYHTALWVMAAKTGARTLEEVTANGFLLPEEAAPVAAAHCRLMRLRNALHFRMTKANDVLSHAFQADLARAEGYAAASDNEASAAMMADYYEAAEAVERFTQQMIDFAHQYKRRRWFRPVHIDNDGLMSDGRKLYAHAFPPQTYDSRPTLLFRIARRLCEEGLDGAPNLFRGLGRVSREAPDGWFTGPEGGRLLMAVLRLRHASRALRLFHATGILTRLIPEFAPITRLSQFDMFHRYTVDEHILHTIRKLEDIPEGASVDDRMRRLYRATPDVAVIKLALLLHDLGKRALDHHATEGDVHSRTILERLALTEFYDPVHFLVERHLLMSNTAQRLDFTEPATLINFCKQVGSVSNLRRLYLLTYADIAGVGPGIWNQWKNKLLLDLYERSERYSHEGEAIFAGGEAERHALAKATVAADRSLKEEEVVRFLADGPARYAYNAEPATVAADMALVARLSPAVPAALRYRANPDGESGELTLSAHGRIGFFATVAGALVAKNVNVVQAQIHTFAGDLAVDTFTVTGASLSLFSDPPSLARFEGELGELLTGKKKVEDLVARRTRYLPPPVAGEEGPLEQTAMMV
ncbi:MAG: hypothetical protein HQK87_08285, partial [Nitrospinae bacterium]|nr:hypothetical protein [Nitrospinota bacterium]